MSIRPISPERFLLVNSPMKPLPFKRMRVEFPGLLSSKDSPFLYPRIVVAERGSCLVYSETGVVHRLFDRVRAPAMTVFLQDEDYAYRIGELLEPVSFGGYSHVFSNEHQDLMLVGLDGSLRVEVRWLDELCDVREPLSNVPMVVFPADEPDLDTVRVLRGLVKTIPLKRGSSLYRGNGLVVIKAHDFESYISDSGLTVVRPVPEGSPDLPVLVELECSDCVRSDWDSRRTAARFDGTDTVNRWIVSERGDQDRIECALQVSDGLSGLVDPRQLVDALFRIAGNGGRVYGLVDQEYSQFYSPAQTWRGRPYWILNLFTLLVWFRFRNRMHIATPLLTQNLRILKLWLPRRQDEDQA